MFRIYSKNKTAKVIRRLSDVWVFVSYKTQANFYKKLCKAKNIAKTFFFKISSIFISKIDILLTFFAF